MWRVVTIGLCLVLCATEQAQAVPHAQANAALRARAERLLARGRNAQAATLLQRAYTRAPTLELALKLARASLPEPDGLLQLQPSGPKRSNLDERALTVLALVDALPAPSSAADQQALRDLFRLRAWALALRDDFAGATAALRERGARGDAQSARYLRGVATLAALKDDLASAESALLVARNFMPEDADLAGDLGAVQLAQGRAEEASIVWEERLRLDVRLDAKRDLASALLAAGRAKEAWLLLEAERAACDAAPDCALEAARAALELGDHQASANRLAGTFVADPITTQFLLADALTRMGAKQRAREAYGRILAIKPANVRASENLRALDEPAQESTAK